MSDLAKEIKNIRKKIGLSARAFAKAIGSNVCSIYNFENGRSEPKNPLIMERARNLYNLFLEIGNDADCISKNKKRYIEEHEKNEEYKKGITEISNYIGEMGASDFIKDVITFLSKL